MGSFTENIFREVDDGQPTTDHRKITGSELKALFTIDDSPFTKMTTLIFATNNSNKVGEIQQAFEGSIKIISLKEAGINIEIEEPHDTLKENAQEKCRVIHRLTGLNCFGEDTGLEVTALHGAPGVRSARYAGEQRSDRDNIELLVQNMVQAADRSAQFRTIIALIWEGEEYLFEGICKGSIATNATGTQGFGYDPIFIPESSNETFAEIGLEAKNKVSHRKKAMQQLVDFLAMNK